MWLLLNYFTGSSFGYEYVPFLFAITSCSVPCSAYPHLLLTARSAAQYNISVWLKVFPSYRFTFHEAPLNRLINYTQASFCNWHPSFRNRALFPSTIFQQFFLMYVWAEVVQTLPTLCKSVFSKVFSLSRIPRVVFQGDYLKPLLLWF